MSSSAAQPEMRPKVTTPQIRDRKGGPKLTMVTAYDYPVRPDRRRSGGRHDPGRRLRCERRPRPRHHARHRSRHDGPSHRRGGPGPTQGIDHRRPSVVELSRLGRGHDSKRRAHGSGGRGRSRQARGRPQTDPDGVGLGRHRNTGHGPHRADPAIDPCHGWLPGPGKDGRGGPRT